MRLFLRPPESEVSTLLLIMAKEMGGLILMLSVMLFFAYRDPARNVAIVNALIVGLFILAFTPLWSLYTLDMRQLYPSYLIWGRSFFTCGRRRVFPSNPKNCVCFSRFQVSNSAEAGLEFCRRLMTRILQFLANRDLGVTTYGLAIPGIRA